MLLDYQTVVPRLVRDDAATLSVDDIDRAIAYAVTRYSKDRPDELVVDVVGEDAKLISLPTGWIAEFSVLQAIEYPIGNVPPTHFDNNRIVMYQDVPDLKIMLLDNEIANTESVRMSFTARHIVSAVADTIRVDDREPVACWAAAALCDELAAAYSGDSDSTIQVDNVNHGTKADAFRRRATNLRKRYTDELGVKDKRAAPAASVANMNLTTSLGRDRLMHPNRYR